MFGFFQILSNTPPAFGTLIAQAEQLITSAESVAEEAVGSDVAAEAREAVSTESLPTESLPPWGDMQGAQLWMVAGFLILGWVLARRQMKMAKRVNRESRVANKELKRVREHREPAMPLADAPVETQRWQVAMFDLQRELKAELDTRISIVQTLLHQVDRRIERLETLESTATTDPALRGQRIKALSNQGHPADEIATKLNLPIGEVELLLGTSSHKDSFH